MEVIVSPGMRLAKLYQTTTTALERIGIQDIFDYRRYRKIGNSFVDFSRLMDIEQDFANKAYRLLQDLPTDFARNDGVNLLVSEGADLPENQRKKLALFSQRSALITSPIVPGDFETHYEISSWEGPDIGGCLEIAYRFRPEVTRGIILPIPSAIERIDESDYAKNMEASEPPLDELDELSDALPAVAEPILHAVASDALDPGPEELKDSTLDWFKARTHSAVQEARRSAKFPRHLLRLSSKGPNFDASSNVLKLGLVLPSPDALAASTILRLRDEYAAEFRQFQKELIKITTGLQSDDGEDRFRELLQQTDDAVAELHRTANQIKKQRAKDLLLPFVVMVLWIAVPNPQLREHFKWILSGLGLHFILGMQNSHTARSAMAKDPFHFVLRVAEQMEKEKRR